MFCYETSRVSVRTGENGPLNFDPLRCDAVKAYMKHYENFLFLDFMVQNGTIAEKHQASKELEICKRKMKFWERQPHFIQAEATRQKQEMNRSPKRRIAA